MRFNYPALRFYKNFVVPDFATVPKLVMSSFFVIPIPLSMISTILLSLSYCTLISNSDYYPKMSGSVIAKNRILSKASEAFEISSLRKISF